jgi:hypothetical protein
MLTPMLNAISANNYTITNFNSGLIQFIGGTLTVSENFRCYLKRSKLMVSSPNC